MKGFTRFIFGWQLGTLLTALAIIFISHFHGVFSIACCAIGITIICSLANKAALRWFAE